MSWSLPLLGLSLGPTTQTRWVFAVMVGPVSCPFPSHTGLVTLTRKHIHMDKCWFVPSMTSL